MSRIRHVLVRERSEFWISFGCSLLGPPNIECNIKFIFSCTHFPKCQLNISYRIVSSFQPQEGIAVDSWRSVLVEVKVGWLWPWVGWVWDGCGKDSQNFGEMLSSVSCSSVRFHASDRGARLHIGNIQISVILLKSNLLWLLWHNELCVRIYVFHNYSNSKEMLFV